MCNNKRQMCKYVMIIPGIPLDKFLLNKPIQRENGKSVSQLMLMKVMRTIINHD